METKIWLFDVIKWYLKMKTISAYKKWSRRASCDIGCGPVL
jgi:hypothetical protein